MPRHLTPEQKREIGEVYLTIDPEIGRYYSQREVAEICETDKSSVNRALKWLEIESRHIRPCPPPKPRAISEDQIPELIAFRRKHTSAETALHFNVSESTVHRALRGQYNRRYKLSDEQALRALRLHKRYHRSLRYIGEKLGVGERAVRGAIKRAEQQLTPS